MELDVVELHVDGVGVEAHQSGRHVRVEGVADRSRFIGLDGADELLIAADLDRVARFVAPRPTFITSSYTVSRQTCLRHPL